MADVSVRPAGPTTCRRSRPGSRSHLAARLRLDPAAAVLEQVPMTLPGGVDRRHHRSADCAAPRARRTGAEQRRRLHRSRAGRRPAGGRPARDDVALGPILVEPRWGRRGHGSRLMAAAVDLARADGSTRAISWIPEADTVTREFLIGAGWAADGLVRALDTGAGELREIRLSRQWSVRRHGRFQLTTVRN